MYLCVSPTVVILLSSVTICFQSPWESIEIMIRTRLNIFDEFIAWSGTHTVKKMNGGVIPRYLWKVKLTIK